MKSSIRLSLLAFFLCWSVVLASRRSVVFAPERAGTLEFSFSVAPELAQEDNISYTLRVIGVHTKKTQEIKPAERLVIESLPEGNYTVKLSHQEEIYQFSLFVRRKKTVSAKVYIQGLEHRALNNRFYCYHQLSGGDLPGRKKTFYENWSLTEVANGNLEYEKQNFTLIHSRTGQYLTKDAHPLPAKNNSSSELESRYVQMMGQSQIPFIIDVQFSNLTEAKRGMEAEVGDVLLLEANVESSGGAAISNVELNVFQFGVPVLHYELFDDASLNDLSTAWIGKQISGDRNMDDGKFSRLMLVNKNIKQILTNSMWVFTIRNMNGKEGNTYIKQLAIKSPATPVLSSDSDQDTNFDGSQITFQSLPSLNLQQTNLEESVLRFSLSEEMQAYVLIGQEKTNLYPLSKKNGDYWYDYPLKIKKDDIFLLIIVDNFGRIYYTGEVF